MKIQQLRIKNFRNLSDITLKPHSRLNFFVGKNAQGKTSLLEAAYFLSNLQSFRGAKAENFIQYGKNETYIEALVVDEDSSGQVWESEFKVTLAKDKEKQKINKQTWINGTQIPSSTKYLSFRFGLSGYAFHSISFNPADHHLVSGDPALRRYYLNSVISSECPEYLHLLKGYQKGLTQRNSLLKSKFGLDERLLQTYSEQLIQFGSQILLKRLEWINRVQNKLTKHLKRIAPEQAEIGHFYACSYFPESIENKGQIHKKDGLHFTGQQSLPSIELLAQAFQAQLERKKEVERILKTTLVGPHRDDWNLIMNQEPLKKHGSQGEVRSALLALKLSEVELFQETTGIQPLFMLDDFSSELDQSRRTHLMNFLEETNLQVFVTSTEKLQNFEPTYQVSDGKINNSSKEAETELSFE